METFAAKVQNFTKANPKARFNGPLEFLNTWTYQLGEALLTASGSDTEFTSGVNFWNKYGRLLYNAAAGQPRYNSSLLRRAKHTLRTTSQSRILQSANYWATGFFGFNSTDDYNLIVIPEGGTENNTLASYDSCFNFGNSSIYYMGDYAAVTYLSREAVASYTYFSYLPRSIIFHVASSQPQHGSPSTCPLTSV